MGNEISVEMRLKLQKLKQDATRAGQDINSGLASSVKGIKGDTELAEENRLRREKIARARRNAALDAADAQREMKTAAAESRKQAIQQQNETDAAVEAATRRNRARRLLRQRAEERGNRPLQGPDLSGSMRGNAADAAAKAAKAGALDKAAFNRNIGFAALPILNPTSLLGNFASLRQSYKAFSTTDTGKEMQSKLFQRASTLPKVGGAIGRMGLGTGAAGAMAAAAIVTGAAIAVGLALKGLQKAIQESLEAVDRARQLYAKTLQSGGMSQSFVVRQSVLAEVLGVSEDQVMQYGNAIAFVNSKLSVAIGALNETQRELAATAMNGKIMHENFRAFWAKVAAGMAEPLNRLYALISALTKLSILSGAASLLGHVIGGLIDVFARLVAIAEIVPAAVMTAMAAIVNGFQWMTAQFHNVLANSWIGKKIGMTEENVPSFQNTKEAFAALKEVLRAAISVPGNFHQEAPGAPVSINRMPASSWEKMGLVIGGNQGANHAKKTAENTSKLVTLTERLVQSIMPRTGGGHDLHNPMYAQP